MAEDSQEEPSDPPPENDGGEHSVLDGIRKAIPLAMAVVAGALVVIGVKADVLERLVRNHPLTIVVVFGLAIAGVVLPYFFTKSDKHTTLNLVVTSLGGLLLLVATVWAIWAGADSLGDREHPKVSIVAVAATAEPTTTSLVGSMTERTATADAVDIKVFGSALSLRSPEKALIRVIAVTPAGVSGNAGVNGEDSVTTYCRDATVTPEGLSPDGNYKILYWGEAGAADDGTASAELTFTVSRQQFSHVCAYMVLGGRGAGDTDTRYSVDILDLASVGERGAPAEGGS